ncbi:protein-disulfide reductase DsbD domain-containing protein [Oceanospirillum sediminis]|uniref:Thiol:disulfide interchange protein DsbD N-terminal domain-containing protein n=1 Tax=Oceanospirillum sediminis TaxID=2760088 RepID=A0A839IU35_9GAMM|nr:protein-disulfide reductase DsbD domain-containing protein [Oceanospirillum sediminis]MBB1488451.1 hypothetical protein [Oceanospirillum sediminis]
MTNVIRFTLTAALTFFSLQAWSGFFDSSPSGVSASKSRFMPVEEAFRLDADLTGERVNLTWEIEPGHYLYRSRFSVRILEPENTVIGELLTPDGIQTMDEFRGEVEIYRNRVDIAVPLKLSEAELHQGVVLEVQFQGCADAGLCYPPHRQLLSLVP